MLRDNLDSLFAEVARGFFCSPIGSRVKVASRNVPIFNNFTGLSMHAAGDSLLEGRYANATSEVQNITRIFGFPDSLNAHQQWDWVNSVSLYSYWNLFGRDTAIGHALLHPELKLQKNHWQINMKRSDENLFIEKIRPNHRKIVLGKWAEQLTVEEDRAAKFWEAIKHCIDSRLNEDHDDYEAKEIGRVVADRMKDHSCCLIHTIKKKTDAAVASFREDRKLEFLDAFGMDVEFNNIHDVDESFKKVVRMLLLLSVYFPIAGSELWVYIPGYLKDSALRLCFLLWGNHVQDSQLIENTIDSFITKQNMPISAIIDGEKDSNNLQDSLGQKGREIANSLIDLPSWRPRRRVGLISYLKIARMLLEQAVHEKQNLEFSIVVAKGEFASKHIEKISPLNVDDHGFDVIDPETRDLDCDIAKKFVQHVQGNYKFYQGKNRLIFCTPEGKVLFLAKTLHVDKVIDLSYSCKDRKCFREGVKCQEEICPQEDECYIIQVRKDRTIEVYHHGRVCMLYRHGEWNVPIKYGEEYKTFFRETVSENISGVQNNTESLLVLTDIIWDMVTTNRDGASFIYGNISGIIDELGYKMTQILPFADGKRLATPSQKDILKELAVQDGVTFIDAKTGVVHGRRFLTVKPTDLENEELHWGARRTSAKLATVSNDEIISIAVSVDGTIDVFFKGERKAELCYP